MTIVAHILESKGNAIWSIAPEATVYAALELMAARDIGALLVIEKEKLVGILSERDYARKVALKGKLSKDTQVREIMTDAVFFVRPDQTIEECMGLMTSKRIRHLPVMAQGKLVGVISIGDVVKALIADQQMLIHDLESYITGVRR